LREIVWAKLLPYVAVGTGGVGGALTRYWLGKLIVTPVDGLPVATLLINLSGSFALGFFLTVISGRFRVSTFGRLFCGTGFLGAYTTFSSFSNEILNLLRLGNYALGLFYALLSLLGGMAAVWFGFLLARVVQPPN
jgi:fluoride exporter